MDTPVIKPGYQVCSSSFIIEFIATQQMEEEDGNEEEKEEVNRGFWRELELENRQYWHWFMVKLVAEFECWHKFGNGMWDMAGIEEFIPTFHNGVKRIQITTTDTFSRIKRIHVYLKDFITDKNSMCIFEVKKKQELKTLQTLAAETISNHVSRKKDFEHLDIPKQLLTDLNESYDNIWRENLKCKNCNGYLVAVDKHFVQYLRNNTHKFCITCWRKDIINFSSSMVSGLQGSTSYKRISRLSSES